MLLSHTSWQRAQVSSCVDRHTVHVWGGLPRILSEETLCLLSFTMMWHFLLLSYLHLTKQDAASLLLWIMNINPQSQLWHYNSTICDLFVFIQTFYAKKWQSVAFRRGKVWQKICVFALKPLWNKIASLFLQSMFSQLWQCMWEMSTLSWQRNYRTYTHFSSTNTLLSCCVVVY